MWVSILNSHKPHEKTQTESKDDKDHDHKDDNEKDHKDHKEKDHKEKDHNEKDHREDHYNINNIIQADLSNSPIRFQQWCDYFEGHLRHLYDIFLRIVNNHQLLYYGYEFYHYDWFCRFFYNNSSKRIPRY